MKSVPHRARMIWQRMGPSGRIGAGAILIAALVIGLASRSVVRAVLASAPAGSAAEESGQQQADRFKKSLDAHVAQIDGRSLFFTPSAPPPKPIARTDPEETTPKAPTVPSRYEGPAIIGLGSDFVFFADGKRVKIGEESGSVKVKSIEAPWAATLLWEGGEFSVSLFDRDRVVMPKSDEKPAPTPEKPAASIPEHAPPASEPTPTTPPAPKGAESKS